MTSMKMNHTQISGVSNCPTLSEQPVTTKKNAFLGYIPEPTTVFSPIVPPLASYEHHCNRPPIHFDAPYGNRIHGNQYELTNYMDKSVGHVQGDSPTDEELDNVVAIPKMKLEIVAMSGQRIEEPVGNHVDFVEHSNQVKVDVTTPLSVVPIPYQRQNYAHELIHNKLIDDAGDEIHNTRLHQLNSEIQQLQLKVQQLTTRNELLVQDLHEQLSQSGENRILEKLRDVVTLPTTVLSSSPFVDVSTIKTQSEHEIGRTP